MVNVENEIRTVMSELGYIIIARRRPCPIGHTFTKVWSRDGIADISQPFVVIGEATEEEFEAQLEIIHRVRESLPRRLSGIAFPHFYKAVTD